MKKMLMAVVAASVALPTLAVPTLASAQSMREVRHDQRDVRHDQRQMQHDRQEMRKDRRETRQDWREYRKAHRNVYNRPAYVAPRGHRYVRVNVGHRFAPAFYGQRYWISDYSRYRLPAPRAHTRWIRYGNDAVLINARNGAALEVLNGFFW